MFTIRLNVSNITSVCNASGAGPKEMRCSERAGPCGLHAGGRKQWEGLCHLGREQGLRVQAERK